MARAVKLDPPEKVYLCVKCWAPWVGSPCARCGCTAAWELDKPKPAEARR